jgi:CubicO group peptidase (beta-lactamase class C family)/uncharacterized Tic20 family protein
MEKQTIGKKLAYQRKLKGYTQDILSEKSNVAIRTVQRIEKDQVNPQLQTIKLLADALQIEVGDLLILENPKEEALQNKWLLYLHGSPLLGFIFPFSVLFPLFIWLHKRDDHPIYNQHGIKVINFQLSVTILYILAFISLVTIKGWGFLFFIAVVPFNILVLTYNIFKAITTQKCYYPLIFSFLKTTTKKHLKKPFPLLFMTAILAFGCSSPKEKSEYDQLLEYEGTYEYVNKTTLDIRASELDTTLYAVIDKAKYPLKHIALDSFANIQDVPVVFERDKSNRVTGYQTDGIAFKLISSEIEKISMYPRKLLFHNPDNYVYHKPTKTTDGLETGSLKDEFKNPKPIIDMVKATIKGEFPDVHSILIYKNNKLVLEEYFYGYDKNTAHQLRSATKPFIGGILGIAVDKGFIKSEKDKLLPYFNSKYPKIANLDDRKKEITIENFLRYRHGMDCENNNPESIGNEQALMASKDWVKYTLDVPMVKESGKSSSYCTGCALTLGVLVEMATNKNIEDFAKENLFNPLGISNYDWTFEPNQASMTTFSQMYLTPRDLIKLAKLFKDGGKWKGKQLISESWMNKTFDMKDGEYGYLWYKKYFDIEGKRYSSYMASGNGGQKINIWPKLDMISVFTGGNYNSYQLYGKSTAPNEMIPNYILEALKKGSR